MKSKIIICTGSVIALFYTLLMILAIDGFNRTGTIDNAIDFLLFENDSHAFLFIAFCAAILVFYYKIISYDKNRNIAAMLMLSFIIGVVLLLLITKMTLAHKYLFEHYISWFFNGVYYQGEDKITQVFSFILRLVALCFCCGGVISLVIIKFINRRLSAV